MKHTVFHLLLGASLSALLYGCAPVQPTLPAGGGAAQVDPACTVSEAVFTGHIQPRHCAALPPAGANQFVAAYCTNAAAAQTFCRMVQAAPNKTRVVQPDGRVRYDANLGVVVGTIGEKCGRVIMTSAADGAVVTQFPETANAPGACQ